MGVVIRQSIYTTIISYLGISIGYINLLYLYPRFLALEQIGLLRTIQDASILLAPFAQMGLAFTIVRYYPQFTKHPDDGFRFINFTLLLSLVGYGLFLALFFLFKSDILTLFKANASAVSTYVDLILWLTFILVITTLLEFYGRALLKLAFPNMLREIGIRLMQAAVACLFFADFITFGQFLFFSVIIYLISLIILVVYLTLHGHFKLRFSFTFIPLKTIGEMLIYSWSNLIGTSANAMIGKLDSIMVTAITGLTFNAIYTTAFYMGTVIEIPRRSITQATSTLIARAFKENQLTEIATIYKRTAINQFIIGSLLLIGIWANTPNIFRIMPNGEVYQAGSYVVLLVGIAKLIEMLCGPNGEILYLSKHYWLFTIALVIMATIAVVSNLLFIPRFGIEGAAIGTISALFFHNVMKTAFVYVKLKMHPFSLPFLKVVFIASGTVGINYLLPVLENVFLDLLYRSAIITIFYGGLVLLTGCSEEINRLFRKALSLIGWRSK